MSPLVRSTAGTVELNGSRVARLTPTRDADGIVRLRKGETVTLG